jgi:hypothetical protein
LSHNRSNSSSIRGEGDDGENEHAIDMGEKGCERAEESRSCS